jgi:glucose/arabinose dehydrogenase
MKRGLRIRLLGLTLVLLLVVSLSAVIPAAAQDESEAYAVSVQMVAEGLSAPVMLVPAPDDTGRLFVVDQAGMIRIISPDGGLMPDPFLDLSGLIVPQMPDYDERGVLGLAFHPDYANNGRFFVYYSEPLRASGPAGWDHTNVLSEFNVSADDPNKGDLASQKTVLEIDQPQFNHDSGHITFGPDGFLYIPIGDGGGANDTDMGHTPNLGNGQDTTEVHGSILRIDVNGDPGTYAIPPDNPFAGQDGKAQEIYAYGFRNPYHISFDKGGDNQLFAADAGQDEYEEVDIVTLGGNYGWNIKEGTHCFNAPDPKTEIDTCSSTGADGEALIDPIIEYSHDDVGVVVIGGYVYRGSALSDLEGDYIFGDYSKTQDSVDGTLLWAEPGDNGGTWKWGELQVAGMPNNRLGAHVLAIGQDNDGELYVMTTEKSGPNGDTGKVWKLVPATEEPSEATAEAGGSGTTSTDATAAPSGGTQPTAAPSGSGSEPQTTPEPSGG